jgi:hypothetical protein
MSFTVVDGLRHVGIGNAEVERLRTAIVNSNNEDRPAANLKLAGLLTDSG